MDTQALVTNELDMIEEFAQCVAEQGPAGPLCIAMVRDRTEDDAPWELWVATRLHKTQGPLAAYEGINVCFELLEDTCLKVEDVRSVSIDHPLIKAIRGMNPEGIQTVVNATSAQWQAKAFRCR